MLYKNGVRYYLTEADRKEVVDTLGDKWPKRIKWAKNKVHFDKLNNKNVTPASITIPMKEVIMTKTGAEEWAYSINGTNQVEGLNFTGTHSINENQIELAYYLGVVCPYVVGSKNAKSGVLSLEFENLERDANEKAKIKSRRIQTETLIWHQDHGLKEQALRQVAKALFVPRVDSLSLNEVREAIEREVNRGPKQVEQFLSLSNVNSLTLDRGAIQRAIDLKIVSISKNRGAMAWVFNNPDGQPIHEVVPVAKGASASETLFEFLSANHNQRKSILDAVKERSVAKEVVE